MGPQTKHSRVKQRMAETVADLAFGHNKTRKGHSLSDVGRVEDLEK